MSPTEAPTKLTFSEMTKRVKSPVIVDLMTRALTVPNLLSLAAGFTSNETLPVDLISEAFETLKSEVPSREYLQYGTNQGRPGLREEIVKRIQSYPDESQHLKPEHLIVSNGSQQTLYIAMQALCNPGDILLVEEPSYFVFLELLKGLGIEAVSIPSQGHGKIDVEGLKVLLSDFKKDGRIKRLKGVYLVSYYSNPSSWCLPLNDKRALGYMLKEEAPGVAVIEDAAYRDLYYETPHPAPSILSIDEFESFPRLYLGTFTKPFSCGLKIGYGYCTDDTWRNYILGIKGHHDFGSANFSQALLENILKAGKLDPYLESQRVFYKNKANILERALEEGGLKNFGWSWDTPQGGLFIWAQGPERVDLSMDKEFCKTALENGVMYVPGNLCSAGGRLKNCARLSFGTLSDERLAEAGERFVKTAKRFF